MNKLQSNFDDEAFNFIKGLAVILLFFHHFFTFPELYLSEFYYPELQFYAKYFQFSTNLCVALFAFLNGYGFWFANNKSLNHFFIKIKKTYIIYWIVFLLFLVIAVASNLYTINFSELLLEFFGFRNNSVDGDIITFFWYMPFYSAVLLILTVLYPFISRFKVSLITEVLLSVIVPLFLFSFLGKLVSSYFWIKRFFVDLQLWFPCVSIGLITAKFNLINKIEDGLSAIYGKFSVTSFLIPVFLLTGIFYGMYKFPGSIYYLTGSVFLPVVWNMSTCYVVFLVYSGFGFYKKMTNTSISLIIAEFGKYSLYMWLLHGMFFNVFKNYTQPILFLPKFPVFVLIWGLFICLLLSKIFEALIKNSKIVQSIS